MEAISANQEDREGQNPKSYAEAVEKEAPTTQENANGSTNGENKYLSNAHGNGKTNGKVNGTSPGHAILKITNTNSDDKSANSDKAEKIKRPEIEREESRHEYSGEGIDDTSRSPPRHKARKNKASSSNSSKSEKAIPEVKEAKLEKLNPEVKVEEILAKSEQANPENPIKELEKPNPDIKLEEAHTKESSNSSKSEEANTEVTQHEIEKSNPDLELEEDSTKETYVVYEESNNGNGSKLVSVKTSKNDDEQSKLDQLEEKKREDRHLDSGRQAGKRWQESAIRWAPLNVPLQRRLQTLVVLGHTVCIPLAMSAFFFLCAIPLMWPLLVPYLIYCIFSTASTSGTLSHRSKFIRSLPTWSLFASYFPARLHRSQVLPPTRKYIFGYHPHGIISNGAFLAFATEALGFAQLFPGITNSLLTLDANFRVPFYRDYVLSLGVSSVSRESCQNLLSKGGPNGEGMGRAITIVVGGARESLDAKPHTLRLVLNCRKGFIKLAIRTGADLVPVLAFGENNIYDQFSAESHPLIHKFQLAVKQLMGFTVPLFHARGVFNYDVGLMPYRRPINIVVGRPIKVQKEEKPGQEVIDRVHGEYVAELQRLWDTWKDDFSPDRQEELNIIE